MAGLCLAIFTAARAADPPPANPPPPVADAAAKPALAGAWQGALKLGGAELRVVFNIDDGKDGQYRATLDSPDQGATGIPVDTLTHEGREVTAEVKRIAGKFTGTLAEDGSTIKGTWTQVGRKWPLELARLEKRPDYSRPQDPKQPYPYRAEDVTYQNEAAGIKLAGTLTLPTGDKPAPAVILVSGSGPQDRNETVVGHRPFLVLADYLTRRGIAVLRFDDRGVGGSEGDTLTATTPDVAGDVRAGIVYLKLRREIDPSRIGLIGHSEGGLVAPLVASDSQDVAFVVLLAGTGVPGDEILFRQGELILRAEGTDDETIAKWLPSQRKLVAILKEETDPAKRDERLRAELAERGAEALGTEEEQKQAIESTAKVMQTAWFRYFVGYDPRPALRKVHCPVLAINGEKDLQVDPEQNIPPIEKALAEAGNEDYTVRVFPGLNHLFQHCQTGAISEYGKIEETISPEVLAFVADWIAARVK